MADPVEKDLARSRLGPFDCILPGFTIEQDIQFGDFGNPTAVDFLRLPGGHRQRARRQTTPASSLRPPGTPPAAPSIPAGSR